MTGLVGFAARRPGRQALRSGGVTSIGTPADGRALPHSPKSACLLWGDY